MHGKAHLSGKKAIWGNAFAMSDLEITRSSSYFQSGQGNTGSSSAINEIFNSYRGILQAVQLEDPAIKTQLTRMKMTPKKTPMASGSKAQ